MKIRLSELRKIIKEVVLSEISDYDKAHQRLIDLAQAATENPNLGIHPLLGFLRTLNASKDQIDHMRSLVQSSSADVIEYAHELAFQLINDAQSVVIHRPRWKK